MTEGRKVQLGSTVDSTGAKQGFEEIKQAGAQAAAAIGKSAETAAKSVAAMGDGAQQSAAKLAAAEKNIIGSIQRATAAAQAGERGTAAFYEALAKQRGVGAETLRPYLDQLRAAEAASRIAAAGVGQIGISAAQAAAALRGVPAQFTDIVTSIASGQQPLTVLLQQGGQLKDMFGGAGAAARALGGYVIGLVNPFTLAAVAAGALAYAYTVGSDEAAAYSRAIILSGQAAGVTAGQLQEMARGVAAMGAGTQGRAAEILTQIASAAGVGAANMQRFTAAAIAFERAGGPAAEETAKAFADLAKEPLAASLKLNEATNYLTASTFQQIKALEDQGRKTEAAKVAQEAYFQAMSTRTPQLEAQLGSLERMWRGMGDAAKWAWDQVLSIGRTDTFAVQSQVISRRIAELDAGRVNFRGDSERSAAVDAERRRLVDLQASLQEKIRLEQRGAEAASQQAAATKATADWYKEIDKYLSKQQQSDREVARVRELGLAAGKSQLEIEAQIAKVREKYAEKPAKAPELPHFKAAEDDAKTYMRALEGIQKIALDATASAEGLTKSQAKLREIMADSAWAGYSRQQRERIIMDTAEAEAKEALAAANKLATDAAKASAKAQAEWMQELQRGAMSVEQQAQKLADENEAAMLSAAGYHSLAQAIQVVEIARLRERQSMMFDGDYSPAYEALQREIEAREKLIGLIGKKEQREASDKAAKDAAREWDKAADQISQSLTDAIMAGGKSGADYVKDLFRTMVLRPVVQAIVNPVASAALSSLGFSGAAQAAGGASSLGSLGSAASLAGSLGTFGSGFASGLTAWGAEGSVMGLLGQGSALFSGGIASGLGTIAGALGPIALGLGAIYAVAKHLDNSGTPHAGALAQYSAIGGLQTSTTHGAFDMGFGGVVGSDNTKTMVSGLAEGITKLLDSTAQAFGRQAGYSVATAFADDTSGDGAWGGLLIRRMGQQVVNWNDTRNSNWAPREFADGATGVQQYTTELAKDVRSALDGIGLPAWASQMLQGLGSAPTIEQLQQTVAYISGVQQAFEHLGAYLPSFTRLTGDAATQLLQSFGSIDALVSASSAYYTAYYTEAERTQQATAKLTADLAALGLAMPATRDAYRALVDAQDLTTTAGQQTYAALLKLAPAFDQVTTAADAATAERKRTAEAAAAEAQRAADALASERSSLETRFLELQGNTTELRRRELAALAPANRALQERIYALEDAKTAADAAAELRDAWAGVATTIEDEVDRIRGLNRSQTTSLAAVQADFATATAQARAGDKAAAERLPGLSSTLLELSQKSATSALELSAVRESVAASLAQTAELARQASAAAEAAANARLAPLLSAAGTTTATAEADATNTFQALLRKLRGWLTSNTDSSFTGPYDVGGFAAGGWHTGGLRIVGESGPELESTGPARIWSAEQTARMLTGGADMAAMLAELRSLRAEVVDLRAEARATASTSAELTRLAKRWDGDGVPVRNDADTPLTTTVI